MIIDVHTHTGHEALGDFPKDWPGEGGNFAYRNLVDAWLKDPEAGGDDVTAEKTIKNMDELGIDKSVLLPMDFNLLGRDAYRMKSGLMPQRSIEDVTRHFADLQKTHPDRLISFVGIDLRRGEEGLALLRKAVVDWGMKGLKLHSTSGYYPNEREYYPFYELAVDLDIPILFHCGFEFAPNRVKYADPILMDDVAVDFPELRIILAHMGGHSHGPAWHWRDTAISMASIHTNIYMDVADMQCVYAKDPVDFYQSIRRALTWAPDKVLYGTDMPWLGMLMSAKDYLEVFTTPDPALLEKAGVEFTKEEIDMLLGENAVRALKLEETA